MYTLRVSIFSAWQQLVPVLLALYIYEYSTICPQRAASDINIEQWTDILLTDFDA